MDDLSEMVKYSIAQNYNEILLLGPVLVSLNEREIRST